ncbi:MAG: HEAT repeat domain-containing protein [Alphaproteobacteria bacterium]|nr:HEAT repeat domain-containing protein [Alphaproteobacteria bacterium]
MSAAALLLALLGGCGLSPEVVTQGMGSQNPVVRQDMVEAAKLVDDPAVVEALHQALTDEHARIREEAARSLGELAHAESVEPLAPLLDDPSEAVRAATVTALARIEDPAAVEPLIQYARSGGEVRLDALWALGVLGDGRALPLLSELQGDPDPYVSFNARRALAEIGDASAEGAPEEADVVEPSAQPAPEIEDAPEQAPEAEDSEADEAAPTQMSWPGTEPKKEEPPPEAPPPKKVAWPGGG